MSKCTVIQIDGHHQKHKSRAFDDVRPTTRGRIAVARWVLPLVGATSGAHPLGFVPKSISVRNYSNQDLYLAANLNDSNALLGLPELIIPGRVVYNAPFGLKSYDQEFKWSLPGSSYGNQSLILAYIYEDLEFTGDEIYNLPDNLSVNAIESYEKSSTIVAGLTPGGSLAAGATDTYQLKHASADLTVAADGQPMQFVSGATPSATTNAFTLMAGEARSLGARVGYVSVTNLGGAAGGYRILNLYTSQTL